MGRWQGKSRKKPTGGRRWPKRKKRRYELGREPAETRIGKQKQVKISARGTGGKLRLLSAEKANITDPETGKSAEARINSVIENPADPHLVRRNIITKGAVIDTEIGKARVTSRPGQSGVVNAILLEGDLEKKPPQEKPKEGKKPEKEKPEEKPEKEVEEKPPEEPEEEAEEEEAPGKPEEEADEESEPKEEEEVEEKVEEKPEEEAEEEEKEAEGEEEK